MPPTKNELSEVILFPGSQTPARKAGKQGRYANVRFNALKHGVLSRHTVLAHEDGAEFAALLAAMVAEHQPNGPTETHLVEEMASSIWRKRRVLQAEGATINRGLLTVSKSRHDRPMDPDGPARAALPFHPIMSGTCLDTPIELAQAVRQGPEETRRQLIEAEKDLAATERAAEILSRGGARALDRALRALTDSSLDWWESLVEEGRCATEPEALAKFIADDLLPFCRQSALASRSHEAIKDQALGEGLHAQRLESLNRYETHLDRKFERTLAMLLKLKELRRGA